MLNCDHHAVVGFVAALMFSVPVADADDGIDFDRDIRAVLNDHCAGCHGGVKKSGGFGVLSRQQLLSRGDSDEPIVIPGDPQGSLLIQRITTDDEYERMPPEGERLSGREIATLKRWIALGAEWPDHWSYSPLPSDPMVIRSTREHPVDHFLNVVLKDNGIKPSDLADRHTLIRRITLDLTGLLPTPDEVDSFVQDDSANAWDRLITKLLSSSHFGERWGRHWLDEARYADSEGFEKDSPKSDAFRYRDWVIQAINEDLPFDEFTMRQIAGDLLPSRTDEDLIATKFHLQTPFNLEGGVDSEEDRTRRIIDRVNTVGTVWMGTSIGCCQCHDHPYDPFTQADLYSMYAFFNNADDAADLFASDPSQDERTLRAQREEKWSQLRELLDKQVHDKNLNTKCQSSLTQLRRFDNENGFTRYLEERDANRRKTYVFQRGDFLRPMVDEGELRPGTPNVLPPMKIRSDLADRIDLANWLVSPENPLTARVTVNKVWMHLFGRPLATQPDDFGSRGAAPSHPKLLDWLAHWFVHEAKWSRKKLIRHIVTSKAYQRSSVTRSDLHDIDPDNRLIARQNRIRVEAEIVRDICLQASGQLCFNVGGPSVFPPLPAIIAQQTYNGGFKYVASKGQDRYRRGMYTFFRRTAIDPNLSTFDCPDSSAAKPQRDRSNNALQALTTLQNEVFHEAAQAFAHRLLTSSYENAPSDQDRFHRAYKLTVNRPPQEQEVVPLERLLARSRSWYAERPDEARLLIGPHRVDGVPVSENAAWVATVRVMLNLDEFLTRN